MPRYDISNMFACRAHQPSSTVLHVHTKRIVHSGGGLAHAYMHTRKRTHTQTHIDTHTRTYTQIRTHAHIHARTHTYIHTHTRTHTHTHTHTHTRRVAATAGCSILERQRTQTQTNQDHRTSPLQVFEFPPQRRGFQIRGQCRHGGGGHDKESECQRRVWVQTRPQEHVSPRVETR